VERVGERHVAHPQPVEVAQHRQLVLDHVPALDTEKRHQLALGHAAADAGHVGRHGDPVRMPARQLPDRVDPFQRLANGAAVALHLAHVDRPELYVEPALARARQVDAHVRLVVARGEVEVRVLEAGSGVGMGVHYDRVAVDAQRARLRVFGGGVDAGGRQAGGERREGGSGRQKRSSSSGIMRASGGI